MSHLLYPCLWFDGQANEAATYYFSIFPNSKIISKNTIGVRFDLNGFQFVGINGGSKYKFSPANPCVLDCETQEEIEFYWEKLGADGTYNQCGWLDDKFEVSWQIAPSILGNKFCIANLCNIILRKISKS